MGFGPVAIASLRSMDQSAPGVPGLSIRQVSDRSGEFDVQPPVTDANGDELSGLVAAECVVIEAGLDEASLYVADFEAAKSRPDAQVTVIDWSEVNDEVATRPFNIPNPGKDYTVLARCSD